MTTYFCYGSKHVGTTITASSANAFYPVSNLQDQQTIREFRTADTVTTANLVIDLGSAMAVTDVILAGNMVDRTIGLTSLTIEANATDSWGAPSFSSGAITDIAKGILIAQFASQSYRYWRLVLTNSGGNYAGFGAMFMGTRLAQPVSFGWELGFQSRDVVIEGLYGQVYGQSRNYQRYLAMPLNVISKAEVETLIDMVAAVGITLPVWCVPDPEEGALPVQQAAAGQYRLTAIPHFTNSTYGLWDTALSLQELI